MKGNEYVLRVMQNFFYTIIWHIDLLKRKWTTASPEQEKESIDFEDHSYQRPTDEDHKHTTQEKSSGFHFMFLEEKSECSF